MPYLLERARDHLGLEDTEQVVTAIFKGHVSPDVVEKLAAEPFRSN